MRSPTLPKRKPKRSRLFVSAQFDAGAGPIPAYIRDISRSGALLETDSAPGTGTSVRLTCGDTTVDGWVAWVERGWFGVKFDTPLLASEVADPTGVKLAVSAPRTYRSGDIPV